MTEKRGRPPIPLLDRVLKHVEIDANQCWHWKGAWTGSPDKLYWSSKTVWANGEARIVPQRLYPNPVMRVNGKLVRPVKALLDPPEGVRLKRDREICLCPKCQNPDHWTYLGKPAPADPDFDMAVQLVEMGVPLERLAETRSPEMVERVRKHLNL